MGVVLDERKCSGCGDCVQVCAVEALALEDGVVKVSEEECIDCGACIDECPTGALSLDEESRSANAAHDLGAT